MPQTLPRDRVFALVVLAMLAFAGNSLLCRMALQHSGIDAASFTTVRLVSASVVLYFLNGFHRGHGLDGGNWLSAIALFVYAAGFSFAYIALPASTGALLLFGAVQASMIGYGACQGERLQGWRLLGFLLALGGLGTLMLPGVSTPPLKSALAMLVAGTAWGVYSLRGKGAVNPIAATAGNFIRTLPFTFVLSLLMLNGTQVDGAGLGYAALSGALTSGLGYAVWYKVLPALKATNAATVQLSVPVIAALGGVLLLGEPLSWRLVGAALAILLGIALVILEKK